MNDDNLYDVGLRLWAQWFEMWNGRPELALDLVAPRFALHLPLPSLVDAAAITDPEGVARWVTKHRAQFERLTFLYDAGPFVDASARVVTGPWTAEVVTRGTTRLVCGMDVIAFRDGRITEYWTLGKDADRIGDWRRALSDIPRAAGR
jgi:hypothetical protein